MACAEIARATTKPAAAINLIILSSVEDGISFLQENSATAVLNVS
jgi:hypothetical protein